jgi:hypothetical protein
MVLVFGSARSLYEGNIKGHIQAGLFSHGDIIVGIMITKQKKNNRGVGRYFEKDDMMSVAAFFSEGKLMLFYEKHSTQSK